ncbi:MAG: hypothetical protein R3C15_19800 [Thermoleophilia bacterium]
MPDSVVLTLPRGEPFVAVARLVVGGLAARLELPFDGMDDVQLAVESVLADACADGYAGEVTVALAIEPDRIVARIGPLEEQVAARAVDRDGGLDGVPLGRLLASLVDEIEDEPSDQGPWLALHKHTPGRRP